MKTKKFCFAIRSIAVAGLGALLSLPCACAARDNAPPSPTERMQARFEQMDTNKDGTVVLEEFRTAFPNMNEKGFAVIDTNGNNGIERAEWFDFVENHGKSMGRQKGAPMNNIPGDPLIPPPDSNDLPLVRPPQQ